jgi:DNA mismatch repair protein MutH
MSEEIVLARANALAGRTLAELAGELRWPVPPEPKRAKGWAGELVERALGASAGPRPLPDFPELGIELKTIPLNRLGRPQESTFVCLVSLTDNLAETWETSLVHRKLSRVLWVPIDSEPGAPIGDRRIGKPRLWTPSPEQEKVLQADYEEIMDMICLGELDLLSSRLGTYLQVRPKAMDGRDKTRASAADGSLAWTLPRGFYLRAAFTEQILKQSR